MARHILTFLEPGYEIQGVTLKVGRKLAKGEQSRSGAYAILSKRKDLLLRVSLHQDVAEYLVDDSRYLAECWVVGKGKL